MKVLVVGGTGNISSGIVAELLNKGDMVSILVRGEREDPYPTEVRRIYGDRKHRDEYEQTIRSGRFDAVIDMIGFDAEDAASDLRAVAASDTHLVFCSSVCAIGPHVSRVPTPVDEPCRPVFEYGVKKLAAERCLLEAHAVTGAPVTIFRPGYTYGRMRLVRQLGWDTAFADKLRKGRPIAVLENAERARWQALHVDDAGLAFAYCLGRKECFGRLYHLGGEDLTWAELHREAAASLGAPRAELVAVSLEVALSYLAPVQADGVRNIFGWDGCYADEDLARDVPEFRRRIPWREGFRGNVEWLEARGLLEDADADPWESRLLRAAGVA